jgi:hypothetical protein
MLRLLEQLKRENLPIQHSIKRIASQWMSLIAWQRKVEHTGAPDEQDGYEEEKVSPWLLALTEVLEGMLAIHCKHGGDDPVLSETLSET